MSSDQDHLCKGMEITSAAGSVPAETPGGKAAGRSPFHFADGDTEAQRRAVICSRAYHRQGEGSERGCPYPRVLALTCSGILEGPELAGRMVSTPSDSCPLTDGADSGRYTGPGL